MPPKFLYFALLVLALVALVLFWIMRCRPFEIGRERSAARDHESQRKKGSHEPSPLPAARYKFQPTSFRLLNPQPVELDDRLREACQSFRNFDEAGRRSFRAAASWEDFDTLLEFARRESVFVLRSGDLEQLNNALTALAIIEAKRTDFRDILSGLALLHHTAKRIGADAEQILVTIAAFAEPETRKLFLEFTVRDTAWKDIATSWGFREVQTEFGAGFVRSGFESYQPKSDLLARMIAISRIVDADRYQTTSLEIATNLPEVWLKTNAPQILSQQLAEVTGGATAHAFLDQKSAQVFPPGLIIFCIELETAAAASPRSPPKRLRPPNIIKLGFRTDVCSVSSWRALL